MSRAERVSETELALLRAIATQGDTARWVYADWLEEKGREPEALAQRAMCKFIRHTDFEPAWDRSDKDPSKNYGVHGVNLRMVLVGPEGAVQFLVYTQWMLPHVQRRTIARVTRRVGNSDMETELRCFFTPQPADLGYHSKKPMYEGQTPMDNQCEYTGGPCYYDGSGLQAHAVFRMLVEKGHEAVWQALEARYKAQFEGADWPTEEGYSNVYNWMGEEGTDTD